MENGSDDNYLYRNDVTHGGDGIFLRALNGWVCSGNIFVENDCSYVHNNGFEAWVPGNTYIRNCRFEGSAEVDKALQLKSDYMEALTYKNLLLRLQANLEKDPAKQSALLKEADKLRDQALDLQKKQAAGIK